MTNGSSKDDFFVGYFDQWPRNIRWFLPAVAAGLVALFLSVGFLVAVGQNHPGEGRIRWDFGRQTMTGILDVHPSPTIFITPSATHPSGHTVMLTGQGKTGIQKQTANLNGKLVDVEGFISKRGDLDMLIVERLVASDNSAAGTTAPVTKLGRWRLSGEICDGKCYSGAMRPGRGLAHKACANLCIFGGAPPVFVSRGTVDGRNYFLIGGPSGKPVSEQLLDFVAVPVEVEGEVEKRGDLLIIKLDVNQIRSR